MTNDMEQPDGHPAGAASPEPVGNRETAGPEAIGRTDELAGNDGAVDVPAIHAAPDRPRGLNAWFAPGGEDEATDERRADERRNLRLLLLMVAALVLIPTLLTIAALAQELVARRGG